MKPIREPKDVDLIIQSKPWSEEELRDFRKIMNRQRLKKKEGNLNKLIQKKTTPA